MKLMESKDLDQISKFIEEYNPEVVIIEGHDGAGKSRVVKELIRKQGLKVYRPDYMYWNKHVTTKKRWTISAAFFDLIALVGTPERFVIDRCMISGAVYEKDVEIAKDMARICERTHVLHVLVTTDKDSYYKMQGVRLGEEIPRKSYNEFNLYTKRFRQYLNEAKVPFIEFVNEFNVKVGNKSMGTCGGCDNWNALRQEYDSEVIIGSCAHWRTEMPENGKRCPFYMEESDKLEQ